MSKSPFFRPRFDRVFPTNHSKGVSVQVPLVRVRKEAGGFLGSGQHSLVIRGQEGTCFRPAKPDTMDRAEVEAILDGDREPAIALLMWIGELIEANRRLEARVAEPKQRLNQKSHLDLGVDRWAESK